MAYTPANLCLVTESPMTGAGQQWTHNSADAGATVQVTGFITDGGNRGMKVGDILLHRNTASNIVSSHVVITVSTTAPGAVDLSDSTTVASGTNSN
jgi:hypothetical protein